MKYLNKLLQFAQSTFKHAAFTRRPTLILINSMCNLLDVPGDYVSFTKNWLQDVEEHLKDGKLSNHFREIILLHIPNCTTSSYFTEGIEVVCEPEGMKSFNVQTNILLQVGK